MAEFDLIELLRSRCRQARADVTLGIGDDGAVVVVPTGCELVVCTDTLVAGVHFPLRTDAADIGWKALAVNLSDLAAMGATPAWATLALTLPHADREFVERFASGFAELAAQHEVALVGGDTTRGPLTVSVTAFGFVPAGAALRRDGARVGDAVLVTGTIGDGAAGLCCAKDQGEVPTILASAPESARAILRARLDRPQPRIAIGESLRGRASACIDVSDGLVADLGHVARASGVGIEIESARIPASSAFLAAVSADRQSALQLAGGDDYELVFTVAEGEVEAVLVALRAGGAQATRIGRVTRGSGVRVLDGDGNTMDVPRGGWEHFS
jgi:thiamine-monophosphate kinase